MFCYIRIYVLSGVRAGHFFVLFLLFLTKDFRIRGKGNLLSFGVCKSWTVLEWAYILATMCRYLPPQKLFLMHQGEAQSATERCRCGHMHFFQADVITVKHTHQCW